MLRIRTALVLGLIAATTLPVTAQNADSARIADVARRGVEVMPFDLRATVHVFTKLDQGGVQRVAARDPGDQAQVRLVREHLQDLRSRFLRGDFSGPTHIHGQDMPGLATLRQAAPGQLLIAYQDVPGGAELRYQSADPALVAALHQWFEAQLSDHGPDAQAGHAHDHDHAHHHPMPAGGH
ncbi:aspartate carbamoyltransferase [Azohydromonas caseinilytica]|uniref:Aspartate carbamoyltransferase n=1 Tax=Azohydromonas caseinilytica TaxID=2728836 RepID=A0A848FD97_9BURK|nr:aspartate carbamoyltransferase [Azohydromonas caseinilytica]NML16369.1 aspartate carbamoyltransferase [Azohydromonas caseinilytica]